MPPKGSAIARAVVPKGNRKPTIQSFVASASGSRQEVKVTKVKPPPETRQTESARHDDNYLTFNQTLVDEYQFDNLGETEQVSQGIAEDEEYIEIDRLPEEPEVLASTGKHSSGKVG